jgi:uncharacterized surface protein with fasciclin (FAS1) repeats
MKTTLPNSIKSKEEAIELLKTLNDNLEAFHPQDSAFDIIDTTTNQRMFTKEEALKLNYLIMECHNYCDPDEVLLELNENE